MSNPPRLAPVAKCREHGKQPALSIQRELRHIHLFRWVGISFRLGHFKWRPQLPQGMAVKGMYEYRLLSAVLLVTQALPRPPLRLSD
jgi:hypothetical protein